LLSRTETLIRLIKLRKTIELEGNEDENFHSKIDIKNQIEQIIHDIVGLPKEARYVMNEIINKVINQKISTKTAVVAMHEIYKEFNEISEIKVKKRNKVSSENKNQDYNLTKLYKNGYR